MALRILGLLVLYLILRVHDKCLESYFVWFYHSLQSLSPSSTLLSNYHNILHHARGNSSSLDFSDFVPISGPTKGHINNKKPCSSRANVPHPRL